MNRTGLKGTRYTYGKELLGVLSFSMRDGMIKKMKETLLPHLFATITPF